MQNYICQQFLYFIHIIFMYFSKLETKSTKVKGRPKKYSDQQIVACMIYGVKNSIFSLRELEYKIKEEIHYIRNYYLKMLVKFLEYLHQKDVTLKIALYKIIF